ncbi:SusC/RagA family TonB-linked outer membrane protein [Niabella beijingensis]|uniref:SusC/RagA family TonB-linked outer membrane protein n=1 Tax=Niabella beijingensis TaxID=2872700 RepID=UPI001CBAEC2F|nr:TonB-dependent receptor [Niabella beijingensis]MBZ4188386.1 TonB-dependent receptor [Niabella beijingensis]
MSRCRNWIIVFLTLIGVWNATPSVAQDNRQRISGSVTNQAGEPLQGVSVLVKGTTTGTLTDAKGVFNLSVPSRANTTLEFSFTGYESLEKAVEGNGRINVVLTADTKGLDEVVVIGYGTARRKDLTGAVASVQATKLEKEAPRSVQDLLRGNAAGIIIGQSNPGNVARGDADILVRGSGTLKAGSNPLNVVDGVIFDGTFADLNPNDIQSIDILKDASATAVYGAKAANGVVLITTKKGAAGKPRITFNANLGFVEKAGMPRVMNGEEFLNWRYDYEVGKRTDAFLNQYPEMFIDPRKLTNVNSLDWYNYDQKTPVTSVTDEQLIRTWLTRLELKAPEIDNYMANKVTDWQDLVFQRGFQQDYTAAVSNKNDNSSYYFSLNHVDREGIVVGNRFKNFRTRLNLESKVTSFLKVGANTNFAVRNEGFLQANWGQSAVISPYGSNNLDDPNSIYQRLPTGDATPVNPFYDNQFRDRKDLYSTLNSSLYGIITLPFGFEFQSNFTPSFTWREYYNHESSLSLEWNAKGGASERRFEKTYNWQVDNVLRWKRRFDIHSFEVTLLQNAEKGQYWMTKATTSNYSPSDILGYHRIQAGTVPLNESNDTYRTGEALMARLFYSLKDKYMLTASVRRDGYSAFGTKNPRATFPALAFAWDFSEESFMKNTSGWLDYAKLRLSWGKNGNRDIGQYEALSDMTSGLHPYIDQSGNVYIASQLYVNRMANLALKWESKASYNIGLDFSLFKSRLSGTIDAYTANTYDLLVDRALPEIIGFNSVAANLGQMNNKGFEVSLNGIIIRKKDFGWNSSFIFMLNRRKIVHLYGDMIDVKDASGNVIGQKEADDIKNHWFIGQDPDRYWNYERTGVWQIGEEAAAQKYGNQPGDFKYKDQNGDSLMTDADRIFQGYKSPRFRWTWRNDFNYKQFSLSVFIYSNWGQREQFNRASNNSSFPDRTTDYVQPRWTPENPINDYARIGSKNIGTNYVDRSFIRLDNVSLSYAVPQSWLNAIKAQSLRISASVRNVAFWAPHWKYGDPESGGYRTRDGDGNEYTPGQPTPRTYNLSLNLTL